MSKSIPDGFYTITPHAVVADTAKAIEFYKKAFGAQEIERFMSPDGKAVMHAQLKIGNSMLMLGNEVPLWETLLAAIKLGVRAFHDELP